MASSNLVQPPSFSHLWRLVLWRSLELTLLIEGSVLLGIWGWYLESLCSPDAARLELAPLDVMLALGSGPACLLAAWMLRRQGSRAAPNAFRRDLLTEPALALVALPSTFSLAPISRLPFVARLLGARLEFAPGAIAIKWRFGERHIAHREIARADWQPDGVLVLLRDGTSLLIPTGRPPFVSGPSGQYPEIGQAVQSVTFAVLRHNQDIAERIRWECERVGGPSYRRPARPRD
jgi:hypothetical protein